MNYEFIKNVYENMPKKLKFAMTPIFQKLILKNATYKKTVAEIHDYSERSKGEQEDITWKKLQQVVRYAYQHSEYYRKLFDSVGFDPNTDFSKGDYKKVPCINKNIVVEQGTLVMSDEKICRLQRDPVEFERLAKGAYQSKDRYNIENYETAAKDAFKKYVMQSQLEQIISRRRLKLWLMGLVPRRVKESIKNVLKKVKRRSL